MNKPFAITLDVGSSLANKTGSWRTERPVYRDLLPPCNDACPAGENIQAWLYEAEAGGEGYERAWRKLMEDNPFPAIMGRVCYHPCETACNRAQLDTAVGINSVERFLGDEAIQRGWTVTADAAASGKRVLVVGAGPSGLSAAYHLARLGHDVTVRDAEERAGGMMRYGIPRYRLPREILDAEIARIARPRRDPRARRQGRRRPRRDARRRVRCRLPRGRRAHRKARVRPGGGGGADPRRGHRAPLDGGRGAAAARPARRGLRRRQHGDGRRPHGAAARRDGRRRGLPPHPRPDARARLRGRGGRGGGRPDEVALDRQAGRGRRAHDRADGARRERVPAADRRARGARGRRARARARPGVRPRAARRRARASRSTTESCRSARTS